jgi:hypothetical protein
MTEHDIPLSAIVIPAEVIEVKARFPRPKGIHWNMLPQEKVDAIPVLRLLAIERRPLDDR